MIAAQCDGFLKTPPLWHKNEFDVQQFEFPGLVLDSFQPKAIPQNIRLGHQMEYVFKQLIEYSEYYNIVLHNLPISQDKRTIGEIDFILEDKAHKYIHVELTYKFYIIDSEVSDPIHSLIGPNRRDTFFAKMQKIKNVQFPLLHSEAGAKALYSKDINHLEIEHQCSFKAQLFKLYGSSEVNFGVFNNGCLVGSWLRFDDFNTSDFASNTYYLPTKSEWVIEANDQVAWKSHFDAIIEINLRLVKERAPMVWMKITDTEFKKLFVVWW
jgi:hypothetical protein